jgi:ERF superfamily
MTATMQEKQVTAEPIEKPAKKRGGQVVTYEPPNMLKVLNAAAQNPAVDPVKMRELWALYMETEAKQQFHDALIGIDFPAISRDGKIPVAGGKSLRFASFENIHRAIEPLLKKHGFRMSFQPMPGANGEGLVVECRLIRGTYEEKCIVPCSTAPASRAMNSQQAIGAAISYGKRYGMCSLLNIRSEAPEDRDIDGNDPETVITEPQVKKLVKAIEDCGIKPSRFMERYKIERMNDLPAKLFAEAIKACEDFGKRRSAQHGGDNA